MPILRALSWEKCYFAIWPVIASNPSVQALNPTPHALTLEALKKQGLSTEGLHSKSLDQFENEAFDVVIVLCDKAQQACRDWQGKAGEILFWDIRDPRLISKLDAYEQALFEIRRRLQLWLPLQKS